MAIRIPELRSNVLRLLQTTVLHEVGVSTAELINDLLEDVKAANARVCRVVTSGKKIGCYVGKVAVRTTGSFNVTTKDGTMQGLNYRFFSLLHGSDGYSFS